MPFLKKKMRERERERKGREGGREGGKEGAWMLPTKAFSHVRARERDTCNIGAKSSLLGVAVLQQHSGVLADNGIPVFFNFNFNFFLPSILVRKAAFWESLCCTAGYLLQCLLRQYLYFCTSKASKLRTWQWNSRLIFPL
jgi:hypothetical protein